MGSASVSGACTRRSGERGDNQAAATLVGTSSANLYSDAIGKGAKFYYWVRFVSGKDDKGPFQGVQGVEAETSRDVQDILDELRGR